MASSLLPTLLRQDLRFAIDSGALSPEVRTQARAALQRKPGEQTFRIDDAVKAGPDGGEE